MGPRRTWNARRRLGKQSPGERAAVNTHRAMAAPAARWRVESEAEVAIFRSWDVPSSCRSLYGPGKGLETGDVWPYSQESRTRRDRGRA